MIVWQAALLLGAADPPPAPKPPPAWQDRAYRITIRVVATPKPASNAARAWMPLPAAWPEQAVETVSRKTERCKAETLKVGGNEMLQVSIPPLRGGQPATCELVLRVVAKPVRRPWAEGELAAAPAKPPARLAEFLKPAPGVESADPALVARAGAAVGGAVAPEAQARALMGFVKTRLTPVEGPFVGAKQALATGKGDCEERAALFVALCRARGLPARSVWTPGPDLGRAGHCWAEVWLPAAAGAGVWAPVDPGMGWFGELPVAQPVMQKGDAVKHPGAGGKMLRYAMPLAKGAEPGPQFEFALEVVAEDGSVVGAPAAAPPAPKG